MKVSCVMKKRFLTRAFKVFAPVLIMSMLCMNVMASSAEEHAARQPDYARKGSVTVDIREADGSAVGGGTITLIPAADAVYEDGDNFFAFNEDFKDCGADLQRIDLEESGAPGLAEELAAWAEEKGLAGTEKEIDASGRAVFADLSLGLYLFIQKTPADGYECVRPFLVTVPMWNGEELVYDVEAGPKPGTATGLDFIEPFVKKVLVVKKGKPKKEETFKFLMVPDQKDQPMPELEGIVKDPATGALTVVHGPGSFSFGKIWFGSEDVGKTYVYTFSEIIEQKTGITYDKTIYVMTVRVEKNADSGNIECSVSYSEKGGEKIPEIVFTNVFDTPPDIPQTGQLWWPVPVLAIAGVIFLGIGLIQRRRPE